MVDQNIIMGKIDPGYKNGHAKLITFCVTEECNLRCKYCYMTGKNSFKRMSLDVAKRAVDFFLNQPPEEETVVWDFIGGEPSLEIELIDSISDYIKQQMFLLDHPWFSDYMFSIGTNGILYRTEEFQNYIKKNAGHVSVSITIDGTKEKHDSMRVKLDGSGSYDEVIESVRLWQTQFPNSTTKVTFSSDDLKYLKDSIVHLWDIGLDIIPANVVFEDVWKPGDEALYEEQLRSLADYIIEHRLHYTKSVRFFDPSVGLPLGKNHKRTGFCGSGKMVAVDQAGNLFPCIRFLDFCIPNKPLLKTGNINSGYDETICQAFHDLTIDLLNDGECSTCPVASGCASCTGCNYSYSNENSIFQRTKFHCDMHKAQARANEYYWNRFTEVEDMISPHEQKRKEYYESEGWAPDGAKYLYFIIDETCTPICHYRGSEQGESMPLEVMKKGLRYAEQEHMIPVFIGNPYHLLDRVTKKKLHVVISDVFDKEVIENPISIFVPVYDARSMNTVIPSQSCILSIHREHLNGLAGRLREISESTSRINLKFTDSITWNSTDLELYRAQLNLLDDPIRRKLSVFSKPEQREYSCRAGLTEFTLAPNGKLYFCPGFYFEAPNNFICDIEEFKLLQQINPTLHDHSKSIKCASCHNTHCEQCTLQNYLLTGFANIPAESFCNIENMSL